MRYNSKRAKQKRISFQLVEQAGATGDLMVLK